MKNKYGTSNPLENLQNRSLFECEVEPLNEYLKKYAARGECVKI